MPQFAFTQASITEVLMPQYIYGNAFGTGFEKVPYVCRLTINGLEANKTYRYTNGLRSMWDSEWIYEGVSIFANTSGFIRAPFAGVWDVTQSGEFTTNASGSYTGWFINEASDGYTFLPGEQVLMTIHLDNGAGGGYVDQALSASSLITVMNFGTDSNQGSALYSKAAGGVSKNFVMLYDNEEGIGRPITGTFIESDGTENTTANAYAPFYSDHVNAKDKAWGTIVPNNLTNGVRRITQYTLTDASEAGYHVSSDGMWPVTAGGSASTANMTAGVTAPMVLDGEQVSFFPPRQPQTVSFTSSVPEEILLGDVGFTVSAVASSGLTDIQFTASPAGILQIVGNTVTAISTGTATLTARQPGNETYEQASVTSAAIIVKRKQTITLANLPEKIYGDNAFAVTVTSDNASIPLTLSSTNSAVAEVFYEPQESAWKVRILGAGETNIIASQPDNNEYKEASVSKSLTVSRKSLTIAADNKSREINTANPLLTATYTGFIAGENESNLATPAILETPATMTSPIGDYPITVFGATSPNYSVTFVNGRLQVINKLQVITFPIITNKTYGDPAFTLNAESNTGVAPVYSSNNTTVAIVENNEIRIKGAGEVRITAAFPAIDDYGSTSVERIFTVHKKALTITADNQTRNYGADNPQLTMQYDGFVNSETSDALLTKPVVQTTAVKTSEVTTYAIIVGGATAVNYNITQVNGVLTVTKAQLIIAADDKSKEVGTQNPPLTLTYSGFVNNETPAILLTQPTVFSTVTQESSVGEYPIMVSGASANNYEIIHENGKFTVLQVSRLLTFNNLASKTFGDSDFSPGAVLSSGEKPEYTSSNTNVATIVNDKVHIIAAGTTTISAAAPENSTYGNTPVIARTLVVKRAPQYIAFPMLPMLIQGVVYSTHVQSTSGLSVELMVDNTSIVSVEGTNLIPVKSGLTKVTAKQLGNNNYLPAEPFVLEVRVANAERDFVVPSAAVSVNGDGINDLWIINGIEDYSDNRVSIVNRDGKKVFELSNYDNNLNSFFGKGNTNYFGLLPEGTYFYVLEFRAANERRKKTGFFVLKY